MGQLTRILFLLCAVLFLPVLPLLLLGSSFEDRVSQWVQQDRPPMAVAACIIGLLAGDLFLPIPSSVVSTFGGTQLGTWAGTLASWLGMTAGAVLGYVLAARFGRPLAERFVEHQSLLQVDLAVARYGTALIALLRPLPIVAEASVLVAGLSHLSWPRFLFIVATSALGIAAVYSWLGRYAETHGQIVPVLFASVAVPVCGTLMLRWFMARPRPAE